MFFSQKNALSGAAILTSTLSSFASAAEWHIGSQIPQASGIKAKQLTGQA